MTRWISPPLATTNRCYLLLDGWKGDALLTPRLREVSPVRKKEKMCVGMLLFDEQWPRQESGAEGLELSKPSRVSAQFATTKLATTKSQIAT